MAEDNPLKKVHDAIWAVLIADETFSTLVRAGNRIKFDKENPYPANIQAGNLPEVRVVPTEGTPHLYRTSSSSSFSKTWEIQVSTGDKKLSAVYELEWLIYCAMKDWLTTLAALTWNSKAFVKVVKFENVKTGVSEQDLNRNVDGWATLLPITVEMFFTTSDL